MKTAIQQILELESDLTRMFDSDYRVGLAILDYIRENKKELLEKDRVQIIEAFKSGGLLPTLENLSAEEYYKQLFT
jgi:hypothetical protein